MYVLNVIYTYSEEFCSNFSDNFDDFETHFKYNNVKKLK